MTRSSLSVSEIRDILLSVSEKMIASEEILTEADRAIGDGDHGVGMKRGFTAVQQKINGVQFKTLAELFNSTGLALMMSVGGASGAIFGTFFRGSARSLAYSTVFTSAELATWLSDGLNAVQERGKARPGDKTMLDVLYPATEKAVEMSGEPIGIVLEQVAAAGEAGCKATKNMVATIGRAKSLGERSLGHADPGAVSMALILRAMCDSVQKG